MYREERCDAAPTLQCVIVIFPVVSRGCSGVQGGEVCDAAPFITVCYCKTDLCNTASVPAERTLLTFYCVLSALGVLLFWKMF